MWQIILQSPDGRLEREEEESKPSKSTIEYWENYYSEYIYGANGSVCWVVVNIYFVEE